MAFTDTEIERAHAAAGSGAQSDDLYRLGLIYSTGESSAVDLVAAHKWFNLAALRGSQEAKAWRREVADQMTTAQVAEAQRAAREWLRTH
jgi:uncharacterized protein